ncbi:MAG: LuxR C-terminal-related transcriptional regulator [Ginsengibacter sp.]
MKMEAFNNEFNKLFKRFGSEATPSRLDIELGLYKKLWNFFVVGESYYFIVNHHTLEVELVSKEVKAVMGYEPSEYNIPFIHDKMHPEDYSWYLSFGNKIIEFFSKLPLEKIMKYKLRYDYRLRKKNGEYARILHQAILLEHDVNGGFLRSLSMHSDISYLKHDGRPELSFIGMDGEPSYYNVGAENVFTESKEDLSNREKQVLTLLVQGKSSKEIGNMLYISKQTVDTHRKNMIHKKNLNNTSELVCKAIRQGWI